jgi:hypothetical protein
MVFPTSWPCVGRDSSMESPGRRKPIGPVAAQAPDPVEAQAVPLTRARVWLPILCCTLGAGLCSFAYDSRMVAVGMSMLHTGSFEKPSVPPPGAGPSRVVSDASKRMQTCGIDGGFYDGAWRHRPNASR